MPWYTHKRPPASSWRGCHLGWHYLTAKFSNPTNQHHPCASPFHTKKREDISNSPAFNGKASARERRDTMEASWAIATSVSAYDGASWFKFILILMSWTYDIFVLPTCSLLGQLRVPLSTSHIICEAWFNKNSLNTPGRSQLPTTARAMIYQTAPHCSAVVSANSWAAKPRLPQCWRYHPSPNTLRWWGAAGKKTGLRIHESTHLPVVPPSLVIKPLQFLLNTKTNFASQVLHDLLTLCSKDTSVGHCALPCGMCEPSPTSQRAHSCEWPCPGRRHRLHIPKKGCKKTAIFASDDHLFLLFSVRLDS